MSRLKELIAGLCPDGVEYKRLEECCNILDSRRKPIRKNRRTAGKYPYYGANGIQDYVSEYIFDGKFVLVGEDGSVITDRWTPVVNWAEGKIWVNNHAHILEEIDGVMLRYLYHYIQIIDIKKLVHGAIPKLTLGDLRTLKIAVPPLEVQAEIVRILDKFTSLTAELTAELTLRRQQYEYYRDKLLTFGENIPRVPLHDFATITRGVRVVRRDLQPEGQYPVYQNSLKPLGYHDKFNYPAGTAFVISAGSAGEIGYSSVDFWAADDCLCITCSEHLESRYLYHVLMWKQLDIKSQVRRSAVPRLPREAIENLQIPLPPIDQQIHIASILDRFDSLCNNLLHGLPAEIQARQTQYQYYRDKLLTFKEKSPCQNTAP